MVPENNFQVNNSLGDILERRCLKVIDTNRYWAVLVLYLENWGGGMLMVPALEEGGLGSGT